MSTREPTGAPSALTNEVTAQRLQKLILEYRLVDHLSTVRRKEFIRTFNNITTVAMAVRIAQNYDINLKGLPEKYQVGITQAMVDEKVSTLHRSGHGATLGPIGEADHLSVGEYEAWQAWKAIHEPDLGALNTSEFNVEDMASETVDTSIDAWRETEDFIEYKEGRPADDVIAEAEAQADLLNEAPPEDYEFSQPLLPQGITPESHRQTVGQDDYSPFYGYNPDFSREETADTSIRFMTINDVEQNEAEYWGGQILFQPFFTGDGIYEWAGMGPDQKTRWEGLLVESGLLEFDGFNAGEVSVIQGGAFEQVLAYAYGRGYGPEYAIKEMIQNKAAFDRVAARLKGGSGSRPKFSIPAGLREIPDYESITQDTTNLFRSRMGRDPEDWEMGILADEMQNQHRESNAQKITAARAAFNASLSGKQGLMEVEVPNPQLRTQKFIEDRYSNEIGRVAQIGDTANTNRLLIDAITTGTGMVR